MTSRSSSTAGQRSSSTLSASCGACRTEKWCPTEISHGSPATHGLSARQERSVHATASESLFPATAWSPPTALGRMDPSGRATSDDCYCSKVSLSEDLRHELAAIAPRSECDRLAELSGLFHSAGSVHLKGRGEVSVHLDVGDPAVTRRAFSLLRAFGVVSEIRTYARHAFDGGTRYQLHVAGDDRALQVLHEAGVLTSRLTPLECPPRRVVARSCCRAAYLRGALLGGGSLSGPRSPHLEIRSAGIDGAEFLARIAGEEGVRLGVLDRGRHAVAYAKGIE